MRAVAPGRVNLIGDHTDYTGGFVFPMAIDRYTTIDFTVDDDRVVLDSDNEAGTVNFALGSPFDAQMSPSWGRYVAAVAELLPARRGMRGRVSTTIPVGAGLSSSAALEVATALALGSDLSREDLAVVCRRAEHLATGVPTGIMDQLCIAAANEGYATLIDCRSLEMAHIAIPDDLKFVVRFVAHRTLEGSEYADRVAECAAAEAAIGPLRDASLRDVETIADDTVRARARHVVTENARVTAFAAAMTDGDYETAGRLMVEGHESLSRDFATSTPVMDAAVAQMRTVPGVLGARMTGGGFGGCVVAMCRPDTELDGWTVKPAAGPYVTG